MAGVAGTPQVRATGTQADPTRVELTDGSGPRSRSDAAPDILAQRRELADRIAGAVEQIPERLRVILSLYYQEECSFREVGEVLGLTEARICQLHAEAIHRIRAILDVGPEPRRANLSVSPCLASKTAAAPW